jgi:transposase
MEAGRRVGLSGQTGCVWVKRFNAGGLDVLEDEPRAGRPPTHPPEVRSALVSLATQKPRSLGLPFELWTLERLQREFQVRQGVHLSDSTIWTWLRDEGLHWKCQQTWFHNVERHDPEFLKKGGHYPGVHVGTSSLSSNLHRRTRAAFGQDLPRRAVRAWAAASDLRA